MQLVPIVQAVCWPGCPHRGHRADLSHVADTYCPSSLYYTLSSAWSPWGHEPCKLVPIFQVACIIIGCPLRGHRAVRAMQLVSIVQAVCWLGCPHRGHRGDSSHVAGLYCPSSLLLFSAWSPCCTSHAAGLYCPSSLYNYKLSSAWSPWGLEPCILSLLSK